ncbi:P2X purinoceptor 5-like [Glandiceps talaboti]
MSYKAGVLTGRCVPYPGENLMTCQIRAWCPTERDVKPGPRKDRPVLYDAAKFTVFIKNPVQYPTLDHRQTNVLQTDDGDVFLKNCHFDPSNETLQFCPIFGIGEMVEWAGQDFEQMAMKGGSIAINIDWTCHLTSNSICIPKYSFKRIDSVNGLGHNFRFSYKYKDDGVEYRTLTKAYGIMFEITITGQGSRFSFWKMLVSVGALLTYLSIAACLEKGLFGLTLTLPCSDKNQKEYVSDRTTEVVTERVNWTCTRENWGKFCPCSEQDSAEEVYGVENRDATTSTS